MNILALDTSANLCAVAVLDSIGNRILAEVTEDIGKGHAERLMAIVQQVLDQAGLDIASIGKIVVSVGPGSFTGARVGVSTARGLALALHCPVVGVTTLEALAHDARMLMPGRPVVAAIDAHRGEIFAQVFAGDATAEGEAFAIEPAAFIAQLESHSRETVLTGSAAESLNAALGDKAFAMASQNATGTIAAFATIGAEREAGEKPKPLYLRGPDAKPQQGFTIARQTTR